MIPLRRWGRASMAALGACAAALVLCVAAGVDAWRLDPLPAPRPGDDIRLPGARPETDDLPARLVLATVARDPFRPDRRRPEGRYRLPGERGDSTGLGGLPIATLSGLRLLGTAAWPGDGTTGLAALQLPGQPPRVVRVGQTLEGLRLLGVAPGVATFVWRDTTVVLRLAAPGEEVRPP